MYFGFLLNERKYKLFENLIETFLVKSNLEMEYWSMLMGKNEPTTGWCRSTVTTSWTFNI